MSTLRAIFRSMRPHQWPKNLAVLAGLFFSPLLLDPGALLRAAVAVAAFTLVAGAVYIFNDLRDRDEDRLHPRKSQRPIAKGDLGAAAAMTVCLTLLALGLTGAAWLSIGCLSLVVFYVAQNLVYTVLLKRVAFVDALTIAAGFVLRVVMGVWAIKETLSPWIVLCSFHLALFMALGKRSREAHNQHGARAVLARYDARTLDAAFMIGATLAIASYALFTVLSGKNSTLVVTCPFVIYGVLRYINLVYADDGAEDPAELVVRDRGIVIVSALWLALCVAILRFDLHIFDGPSIYPG